ncbi:alcohol oxidase-like protein [Amylostereum chailletii]|nr:alcohol oxidase-like protein [Amylostereum chailletii]
MSTTLGAEYDIIIAGGGACGCVVAGRLAAASPALKILILEAGPGTQDLPQHVQPARYLHHLRSTTSTIRFHQEPPSTALGGRANIVACGQCLGGGSSVNFMTYTRASASDYDAWETVYKNPGWGSKDLIPLLEKSETYQVKEGAKTHGYNGPLKVSYGGALTNLGQQFLDTAKTFDPRRDGGGDTDPNDTVSVNKYGRWQMWIDGRTGRRSDVPHHFIYNQSSNTNLQYAMGVHVKRLTFEGNRATGVEFIWNSRIRPGADREVHSIRARRMVLVSAGAFGSPGILERSGIGSPDVLRRVDIPVKVDLPGVGEGYRDHNLIFTSYKAAEEAETLDAIVRGDPVALHDETEAWLKTGGGLMAHTGIDGGIKLRPFDDEVPALGSAFKKVWDTFYAPAPDKPLMWIANNSMSVHLYFVEPDASVFPFEKYYSMEYFTLYPIARGHVHIADGQDPSAPLDFRSGFLESMADVTPLVWAYKYTREIARRMPFFRGEVALLHPSFAEDSEAKAIISSDGPVARDASKIVYTEDDDIAVERHVRENVSTTWHSASGWLGTCAMKPRAEGGVVDPRLNVYDVTNLKVADMSIAPGNVGANTYSSAVVIGEKAALIIAEELGIDCV